MKCSSELIENRKQAIFLNMLEGGCRFTTFKLKNVTPLNAQKFFLSVFNYFEIIRQTSAKKSKLDIKDSFIFFICFITKYGRHKTNINFVD